MSEVEPPPFGTGGDPEPDETVFAQGRLPGKVYLSRGFTHNRQNSADFGQPARFVYKVIDTDQETLVKDHGEEWHLWSTPAGRYHFKLLMVRESGNVKELWIQRVPDGVGSVTNLMHLRQPEIQRLIDMFKALDSIPLTGASGERIDESIIRAVFEDPEALTKAYERDPEVFRQKITEDTSATDVIAHAHRRQQVERFHRLLENDNEFDQAVAEIPGNKPESVWQKFFEANPWILGMSLGGQLLTSWDEDKLERVVASRSVAGVGKRVDALLETSGRIRSMVFAEFKTHRTRLLSKEYREGCWSPSTELAGGVSQAQGTVYRASINIGERLAQVDKDGAERLGEFAYLLRPKSYLLAGQLSEFVGETGGHHLDKVRSFELYRRHLVEPEIITFDELLARADWLVAPNATSERVG